MLVYFLSSKRKNDLISNEKVLLGGGNISAISEMQVTFDFCFTSDGRKHTAEKIK